MNTQTETATLAIEIDSETTWNVLQDIFPSFRQLAFEDNLGRFVIPNYRGDGPTIIDPKIVPEYFDHITPSGFKIKFVNLVK